MSNHCPCGSGRELDRCCSEPLLDPELRYTNDERTRALLKMDSLGTRATSSRFLQRGTVIFWGNAVPDDDEAALEVLTLPSLQSAFRAFLYWDIGVYGHQSLGELALEELGKRLTSGERAFVRAGLASHWGLYEVLEARAGDGLLIEDLWTSKRIWIHERSASAQLVRFDLLSARVIKRAEGPHELEGDILVFDRTRKSELLAFVHELRGIDDKDLAEISDQDFFKAILPALAQWWIGDLTTPRSPPRIQTPEGDEWCFCRARFSVRDRAGLVPLLDVAVDFLRVDEVNEKWAWFEELGSARRSLAQIELRGETLIVETTSRERMVRAKTYLAELAEGRLAHVDTTEESVAEVMQNPRVEPEKPAEEPPRELQREIISRTLDEHYHRWLDEQIPALDLSTPRHAARDPQMRERLIELLKGVENMEERKRLAGEIHYDAAWIWNELGLTRPGV